MITFDVYQLQHGQGPKWLCHCLEHGKSRLVFFGETEGEAVEKAKEWANSNLDTPERREIMRKRAAARIAAMENKKKENV